MNNIFKYKKGEINIKTSGQFLYEITNKINTWLKEKKINQGQLLVFIKHTSFFHCGYLPRLPPYGY